MLFNSTTFGVFLIAVLLLYWGGPWRARLWMLLVASLIFYSWDKPVFFFLITGMAVFNFYAAAFMVRGGAKRKWVLIAAIAADLVMIGIFKYANLAIQTIFAIPALARAYPTSHKVDIYLPLGISFFTFQMMSYLVDVWRGMAPEKHLRDFVLYITFFPQLVAGPIMRTSDLVPQFHEVKRFDPDRFRLGVFFLTMGLVKKVVFADPLGVYATQIFSDPGAYNTPSNLVAVYAYAFQIYFDFSGYSDIAIGCGHMMGFDIMTNFNLPYLANNLADFWHRWHISLSTWLRDYLYIPLGGSRHGRFNTYRNLIITMFLGGLWHGAAWKFAIWGVFHGGLLAANRARKEFFGSSSDEVRMYSLRWWLGALLTFHLVCVGWIFFRGNNMHSIGVMFSRLAAFDMSGEFAGTFALSLVALGTLSHLANGRWQMRPVFLRMPAMAQMAVYAFAALAIALFATEEKAFIYFQF